MWTITSLVRFTSWSIHHLSFPSKFSRFVSIYVASRLQAFGIVPGVCVQFWPRAASFVGTTTCFAARHLMPLRISNIHLLVWKLSLSFSRRDFRQCRPGWSIIHHFPILPYTNGCSFNYFRCFCRISHLTSVDFQSSSRMLVFGKLFPHGPMPSQLTMIGLIVWCCFQGRLSIYFTAKYWQEFPIAAGLTDVRSVPFFHKNSWCVPTRFRALSCCVYIGAHIDPSKTNTYFPL